RAAMGCFATGVTIVTTMTERGPLGMTVNSFTTVSLDPPLVLWSPARKSNRFSAFEAASYFAVHILAADQQPLAEAFAKTGIEAFDGLDYTSGAGNVPLLADCAARFECSHSAGHDGGDHLIVVGEVIALEGSDKPPLLYHRSAYTGVR
ncbi:MAG: flavin reductase family protein, partial [Alphaproteobacteria bacterium]